MKYLLLTYLTFLMASCQTNESNSLQKEVDSIAIGLNKEVRQFFFMDDSVKVNSQITDTLYYSELIQQQTELDQEIAKAQHQIDTLQLYINLWEKKMFELMDNNSTECEVNQAKLLYTTYQLSQNEYKMQKMELMNTSRILLGLKRFSNDSIMGFETDATYYLNNDSNTIHVLMNANHKIVD
jgi:hypothetical protein